MVRSRFPEVILIENKENIGFSRANNQGVAKARGEYVCILNPDTAVAEDTFIKALTYAESLEDMGALGVQLIDGTGNFLPESKRNVPTPAISVSKLFGSKKTSYYARQVQEDEKAPVDVLVGAFMLLKREVYEEIKGFDEDYFMYGEDIDLSYKILKAGYTNHYTGDLKMLHYKGESTRKDKAYMTRFYGAMRIFYRKHFASNVLSNTLVAIGVFFARLLRTSGGTKRNPSAKPTKALILTENLTLLQRLSSKLEIPLTTISKAKLSEGMMKDTLFIFDVDYMPYAHIFKVMSDFRNHNNAFRIRPPGCSFILGSDHSDEKGSVVVF